MEYFEGGIRVSFLLHWPQGIPAGTQLSDPITALDLTPTFLNVAGHQTTFEQPIDGIDITDYMTGKTTQLPQRNMFFSFGGKRVGGGGGFAVVTAHGN